MLCQMKNNSFYYWQYRDLSQKINFWINVFTSITSYAGVAGWLVWQQYPFLWAIILGCSQTIFAISHLLPWQERITKINYFLPKLQALNLEVQHGWENIENMSAEDISKLIFNFQNKYLVLEQEYIGFTSFPHRKTCADKANAELKAYINYFYNIEE